MHHRAGKQGATSIDRRGVETRGLAMRGALGSPLRLALIAAAVAAAAAGAFAQPSRKSGRRSQPAPISRSAPDTTATIPAGKAPAGKKSGEEPETAKPAAAPPPFTTTHYGEEVPQPFELPAAPRARMRSCGARWHAIKLSGEAGSDTWREFATKCLVDGGTRASP